MTQHRVVSGVRLVPRGFDSAFSARRRDGHLDAMDTRALAEVRLRTGIEHVHVHPDGLPPWPAPLVGERDAGADVVRDPSRIPRPSAPSSPTSAWCPAPTAQARLRPRPSAPRPPANLAPQTRITIPCGPASLSSVCRDPAGSRAALRLAPSRGASRSRDP